jgi:hypothetical protein
MYDELTKRSWLRQQSAVFNVSKNLEGNIYALYIPYSNKDKAYSSNYHLQITGAV